MHNTSIHQTQNIKYGNFATKIQQQALDYRLFQTFMIYYQPYYYLPNYQERQLGTFKPQTIKIQQEFNKIEVKKEDQLSQSAYLQQEQEENNQQRNKKSEKLQSNKKIKKRRKQNDKSSEKNLLVHLKLWLQRFFNQIAKSQPSIKKQFDRVFKGRSRKSRKQVYMNMGLLQKIIQNLILRPFLQQFFERRILRHLASSNIKNKLCIIKYVPILFQKFIEGKCRSLK